LNTASAGGGGGGGRGGVGPGESDGAVAVEAVLATATVRAVATSGMGSGTLQGAEVVVEDRATMVVPTVAPGPVLVPVTALAMVRAHLQAHAAATLPALKVRVPAAARAVALTTV
jgi:hypothetical protein